MAHAIVHLAVLGTPLPSAPILSPLEVDFLVMSAERFCATSCPIETGEGECPLVTWRESVHTGAIERVCRIQPDTWRARLAV